MTLRHAWIIENLERNAVDGGVILAHWICEGISGDANASVSGTTEWTPDEGASDFIAFDNLTQADVLGWIWKTVVREDVQASVTEKINAALNPTTIIVVPW